MQVKVVKNESHAVFSQALEGRAGAERIKDIRDRTLIPGGRAHVRLFESVGGGRPHPRLHIDFPAAVDPSQTPVLFEAPPRAPESATAFATQLRAQLTQKRDELSAGDLDPALAPEGSTSFWAESIRVQRTASFFASVRAAVASWGAAGQGEDQLGDALARVVAEVEDEAYAARIQFDDADTGTYHSYGHDKPFVHYLERLLASLPEEGTEAMALVPAHAAESIRRQRTQLQAHLDHLMRHKYAYEVVEETNIEKTVGGMLIDRTTRHIVSEVLGGDALAPSYETLRVDPGSEHDAAGAWVYRDAEGRVHLQDGTTVDVPADDLRGAPVDPAQLTFERANGDARLRSGMRLDWDRNGYVQPGKIDWVSWAGHCDVKAVLEQLGITLTASPLPSVEEFRSDTTQTQVYDRDLLMEMLASIVELGSMYRRLDGTGRQVKGVHLFGGSRNDSRPDRLQFAGSGGRQGFRWPLGGRADTFVVKKIVWADGVEADMGRVFFRHHPDLQQTTFAPNPRYLKTVEGDYNLIDVSGATLEVAIKIDEIDPATGYVHTRSVTESLALGEGAVGPHDGLFFLGTHVDDAALRRIFRVYWDPRASAIVAKLFDHVSKDGRWEARALPGEDVRLPMRPGAAVATLSREMKRDNPEQFQALLGLALREGKNICADTDKKSAVWNGVVTQLDAKKVSSNDVARTEHWRVDIKARFGKARLDYLVRRDERGTPLEYCPAQSDDAPDEWPDFLWHDIPDVGSKAFSQGEWVVNETMLERDIVSLAVDPSVDADTYVRDEHIKNTFELLFCGLDGVRHTIVHNNKRYGFRDRDAWEQAVAHLTALRAALRFEG